MNERRNVPEIVIVICELLRRSQTRINLLFTMSEIPHAHPVRDATCEVMFRGRLFGGHNGQPVFAHSSFAGHASIAMPGCATHSRKAKRGGARRDRTDDLMLAKHALSQLSYGPVPEDECFMLRLLCARLRWRHGAAAFVQEGLPSRSCRAAKAGGPGKT
jgi:hypothetical protein